jgi:hypothetical protein
MPIDLTTLETLARAATPGPWRYVDGDIIAANGYRVTESARCEYEGGKEPNDEDSAYIAAMSPDVALALIAVVKAAASWRVFADQNPYGTRGDDQMWAALDALTGRPK